MQVGRLTPSFRRLFLAEVERLSQRFRPKLRDPHLQAAYDALCRVWSSEHAAMMMTDIPIPLDAMNLVAAVDAKAELEQLSAELWTLQDKVSLLGETKLQGQTSRAG